ncbi:MAG TPA: S53 family peptidase [Ktedonobacteraceae bacterium]
MRSFYSSSWSGRKAGAFWLLVLLLGALITACDAGSSSSLASSTPTNLALQVTPLDLGIPTQALNAPIVGQMSAGQILHIGITFKINPDVLKQIDQSGLDNGQNAQGSNIASKLGISPATYQQIKNFLEIDNAKLTLSQTSTWLTVDIKTGSLGRLLRTTFVLHKLNNRTFYTPDPAHMPVLPTVLANQILAVSGLDNFSRPQRPTELANQQATSQPLQKGNVPTLCPAQSSWQANIPVIYPQDIAHIYGMDRLGVHGEGMKVILIEAYDTYIKSDLPIYFHCVGYHGQFSTVTLDKVPSGDFGESEMDIEQIAGLAPAASIVDYQGDAYGAWQNGNWWVVVNDLLQRAIADNQKNTHAGTVVSISMQDDEGTVSKSDLAMINQSLQIMTSVEHMSVFVSTGDCAAFSLDQYNKLSVSFPASDPWAVAVGGTILNSTRQGARVSESAWGDSTMDHSQCNNSWGGGGGLSTAFSMPAWQKNYGKSIPGFHNRYSNGMRQDADITGDAAYLLNYYQGQWSNDGGGTSASAPMLAAGMALLNESLLKARGHFYYGPAAYYYAADHSGNLHPFFDVTLNNNIYYPSTRGWDYPSGLGVPNYADLYTLLIASLPS